MNLKKLSKLNEKTLSSKVRDETFDMNSSLKSVWLVLKSAGDSTASLAWQRVKPGKFY